MGQTNPLLNTFDLNEDFQFIDSDIVQLLSKELIRDRDARAFENFVWGIKQIRNMKSHNKQKYLTEGFLLYAFELLNLIHLVLETDQHDPVLKTINSRRKYLAGREV